MKRSMSLLFAFLLSISSSMYVLANDLADEKVGLIPDEHGGVLQGEQAEENAQRLQEKLVVLQNFEESYNPNMRATTLISSTRSEQITSYYCGAAATLQALTVLENTYPSNTAPIPSTTRSLWWSGLCNGNQSAHASWSGEDAHTCYKSYSNKQITLADVIGTTTSGSNFSGILDAIETYYNLPYFVVDTVTNADRLQTVTVYTLQQGRTPIFNVDTSYLEKYSDAPSYMQGGHYITCSGFANNGSVSANSIRIVDPSYYQPYGSTYWENFESFSESLINHNGQLLW